MPILPRHARFSSLLLIASLAPNAMADDTNTASAVFAAGCFWCVEEAYDKVEGVVATTSGFSGGDVANPSYDQVVAGGTGHTEAVKVEYDPAQVDYATLLYVFWRNVDPFTEDQQFCDEGPSYRSALFPMNAQQRQLAEDSREAVAERFERDIATEINDFDAFYAAETYHQNYYDKNPLRYRFYKTTCGRSGRLEEIWGDEAEASAAP